MDPVEIERLELQKKVDAGDPIAVIALVQHYLDYESPEECLPIVTKILEDSVQKKSARAAYELWRLYDKSPYEPLDLIKGLVPANRELALKNLDLAAEWGHPEALLILSKKAFRAGEVEKSLDFLDRLENIDPETYQDQEEMFSQVTDEADDFKMDMAEEADKAIHRKKILENIDAAAPEELYNLALSILRSSSTITPEAKSQAIHYLQFAAIKGLVLAKKLLKEVQ